MSTEFTPEELVAQLLCAWREFFTTSDIDYDKTKAAFKEAQARVLAALRAVPGRGKSVPPQGAGASATEFDEDFPSIRDQFAMAALTGMTANSAPGMVERVCVGDFDKVCGWAYMHADAMLEARKGAT